MKIKLLFLGKTRAKYIERGIAEYTKRLGRYAPVEVVVLKEKFNPSLAADKQKKRDGELLLDRSSGAALRVVLDQAGRQPDSVELAEMLTGWEMQGIKSVSFLIGGHLGLDRHVLEKADFILSLSRLTFTHEMSRLLLLEQLYRAYTIKSGHSYHK